MQTLPANTTRKAPSRPTPVEIWQQLLTYLLEQHYGLSLHDTPFSREQVIRQHIDGGISLADAINFLVEKYELVRIERPDLSMQPQSHFIGMIDILRARRATGLMQRNGYKRITLLIAGNADQEQHL